jgi:hypothetical protein
MVPENLNEPQHKAAGFVQYQRLVLWMVVLCGYRILEKAAQAKIDSMPFLNSPGVHDGNTTF